MRIIRYLSGQIVTAMVFIVVSMVITAYQDPRTIPSNVVVLVAWVGWAIGLRYWAEAHSERAAAARG